ncbi:rho GTPase-activating protein 190 isoform X3 [Hyalella azteca]|uniref:Rho GTPase-activating protein 190 isoform X3 n=1 Tax=Hyalella azteca TaxID=294128 RepID=A0A979FVP9_HYAAZ|nr:rho GTPase-activating protein 190 isoform X3 [Hyalella azteca]
MARRGECGRQVVVSVVGVSGGEREKGVTGVGKSCLCNRFIRPQADNYHVDHISVLSQTDFSGRVVNNDHFLYWGETTRVSEDAVEYNFQVIEQTEFIDDASFMPFKAGKMDPYIKRCCQTKITSAEKLMYICKNQLGIEREYEQKVLPDGKLNVDGFLCIFDVSPVPNRSLEKMVELTASILNNCVKTKRPVVLVTTKNDEANEIYVKEAEKLASRKEFKGNIPLVETSSHETVNVETAFMTVAQLVERNRGRVRILPYYEAARHRKEMIDVATDGYLRLVRSSVTDYRALWSSSSKKLSQSPDFVIFVDLMGLDCAAKLFRRHTRKLKDEFLQRKVESYMDLLPSILREFFPNLRSLQDGEWLTIQQRISEHPDFERYFLRCHEDLPWTENLELLDSADSRIPFDVLDSNEAETVYKNHVNALQAELEMREMRDRFKQLLEETGYVTAGKRLDEVRVLFMGRESFDSLTEHDRQIIYDQHQKEITEKARANYMELLLEHAELFNHFKSVAPNGSVTQEDVRDITQALNTDSRHKALDRLDGERTLLLLQHLGFIHCPKPEHCPAYPNCTDTLVNKILAARHAARPNSWSGKSVGSGCSPVDRHINLVLLGKDGLAQTLHAAIRAEFAGDEVEVEGEVYCLDYRTIEGDVTQPQNAFATPDFSPHGVVCVYSTSAGLDYLRASLEHQLLGQLERDEAAPTTAILYAPHPSLDQLTQHALHQEGTSLAQSLQCSFVDAGSASETGDGNAREDGEGDVTGEGSQELDRSIVNRSIRKLVTSIHHRTTSLSLFQSVTLQAQACPDIRVIMCVLCGDPYSLEAVLNPLLSSPLCVPAGDRTLQIHSFLDESKRVVEVCVSSYHGALAFREELVHGFILVYSAKRRASLAALKAFSANIPNLPIQVLAVTESGSASAFFGSEVTQQLMTEGNAVADRLQAHYTTTNASPHQTSTTFTPFFKEVWDKKPEIEQAFNMEDPSGLEDSGEGTLERPGPAVRLVGRGGSAFTPVRRSRAALPPRSHSAEGSEIYESVPPGCEAFGGSLGDDLDEPLSPSLGGVYGGDDVYPGGRHPAHAHYGFSGSAAGRAVAGVGGSVGSSSTQHLTPSDDSDIYSHIDNEDDEQQLVKPSQLKKQRRFQQDSDRCTFPSTESLPTSISSPRVKLVPTPEQTYQNAAIARTNVPRTPKAKRSNSTCSSPPASSITAHSASSLYKQSSSTSTSSPPMHKAASQQIAREHSFDGSLANRHGASFRRRGSATNGSVSASSTALRGNRNGGGTLAGLLMGGLDLIPSDNPPPVPPPLNLAQLPPFPKTPLPPLPQKDQKEATRGDAGVQEDKPQPQPAPRRQFLKSESVETGIGSGSGSSNSSSRSNTNNKAGDTGTISSTKSCNDDVVVTVDTVDQSSAGTPTVAGGGGGGGSSGSGGGSSVGGLQVYPPPTTPPEPAPPDRESTESGGGAAGRAAAAAAAAAHHMQQRRLVKATTLPAPTFHTTASRTSLEDLTSDLSGSRESLTTRDSGTAPDNFPRWVDDSALGGGRKTTEEYWVGPGAAGDRGPSTGGAYQPHSSTTGRRGRLPPPPTRVKPKSSHTLKTFLSLSDAVSQVTNKQPGKLNLKAYSNVTDALSKLAVGDGVTPTRLLTKAAIDSADSNAPLATPESAEDLGGDYSQVKDAVPGLYPDAGAAGEFAYARVPELSQAASAKARQRQRREKQQGASTSACSDSDSDWSSLERRRNADSSRKGVPKRVKKKRIPIPVATPRVPGPPRVPPLPGSMFTADVGMFGAAGALGDDSKPLLLDQPEKGSRSGESSEESDGEQSQLPNEPLLPPPNTAGLQKKGFQFKSKTGREGVAVRPPVVPFAPSVRSNSSSSPHNPSSLMGRGMAVSSPRPPFQLTPDSDVSSPLCRGEGPDGGSYFPDDSSMDMPSPRDMQSPNPGGGQPALPNQTSVLQDKNARKKQEKLRNKEEARIREDEKKRVKEEEKAKKKERENKKKSAKSGGKGGAPKPVANWEEFIQSPDHPVPLFVDKCVQFIELEGLDSEGIYRVPGNKIHVEHLSTKYKEDSSVDFATLDVPVNAAATALKDYLKQLPPLLPPGKMEQLTAIAASPLPGQGDRSCRLLKLKELLTELPSLNFLIIKFIFQHFVRVAEHSKLNSMDSKNLAICWWPTLFHTLQFTDIVEFESLRPHIEDIVQTMIDQFPFLFQGKEDYVMV